ncbi:Glucose 1-dehydrogenase [Halotydeus destructor]|nr:Glucose 1-dehydrogenase [Halotydeus destructor]
MYDFSDKVVIVTGSSSGIGQNAAISFAKQGAQVVVTGRNAERVTAVAAECVQASPTKLKPLQIVGDVSNDKDAKRLIDDTIAAFGHLDVLVNNAGFHKDTSIMADDVVDKLDDLYKVNVRPVVKLINLAAPHLIASKGNVINVSSVASTEAGIGMLAYSISKAAVDMVTKCCALELGPKGVRVNSIRPAAIATPFMDAIDMTDAERMAMMKLVSLSYPLRRIGTVQDTSAAILFLASQQASFFSGVALPVDGGMLSMSTMAFAAVLQQEQANGQ